MPARAMGGPGESRAFTFSRRTILIQRPGPINVWLLERGQQRLFEKD